MVKRNRFCLRCSSVYREALQKPVQLLRATFGNDISDVVLQTAINNELAVRHVPDRKINPGPPVQRFMKPPLSRYIALAQRRTMALMSRRGPLLERGRVRRARVTASVIVLLCRNSSPHSPISPFPTGDRL